MKTAKRSGLAACSAMVFFFIFALVGGMAAPSHGAAPHSSGSPRSTAPVHVKGYTRKDGTVVPPHERARSGQGHSGGSASSPGGGTGTHSRAPSTGTHRASASTTPHPRVHTSHFATGGLGARDSHGRIQRSEAAKHEFMRQSGYPHGRPGYVVDHVMPLKRGGADSPRNMQWQTIEEAKRKDKWE